MDGTAIINETIECATLAEAIEVLERVKARLQSAPLRPMLEMAGRAVHLRTLKNFLDSQAPDGTPWAPVRRPGWQSWVQAKPLIKTGALFGGAATATANPNFWGDLDSGSQGGSVAGLNIDAGQPWYGGFHNTGTAKMVARPWLGVNEEIVEDVTDRSLDMMMGWVMLGSWAV